MKKLNINDFWRGINQGTPIALGYLPVSFTFGLISVNGGISPFTTVLMSLTNLTSAGQFAGAALIISGASYFEIIITTFVINIRYMLMSLALSQKVINMHIFKRCVIAFGITDETFTVASLEKKEITFAFMLGLITGPYIGWGLGTTIGAITTSVLSKDLQNSMGIALYAMFIALIIPATKKSKATLIVVITAIFISSTLRWSLLFHNLSSGWGIIVTTIIAAGLGASFFPREEN